MSDNSWRIKRYYGPRVLIDLAQLETSPFEALVLCLSGPERSILQNLMQYAHRRSTFVSEYHDDYYLAPSEAEWDDIDALVAGLEDKLMNCEEFTQMLEDILAAAECACEGAIDPDTDALPDYSDPSTPGHYDDLVDDETLARIPIDDTGTTPGDEDACAVAQLAWQFAYEATTEFIQPAQDVAHTVLLSLFIGWLALQLGATVVGIPVAFVLLLVGAIAHAWVQNRQADITNWLDSNKQELVCALYQELSLGNSWGEAADAAQALITESTMPDGDKLVLGRLFSGASCGGWTVCGNWRLLGQRRTLHPATATPASLLRCRWTWTFFSANNELDSWRRSLL